MPPTISRSIKQIKTWAEADGHKVIWVKSGDTLTINNATITTNGIIQRTSRFAYPSLSITVLQHRISAHPTVRQLIRDATRETQELPEQEPPLIPRLQEADR